MSEDKEIALPTNDHCRDNDYLIRLKPFLNNLICKEFYGDKVNINQFPLDQKKWVEKISLWFRAMIVFTFKKGEIEMEKEAYPKNGYIDHKNGYTTIQFVIPTEEWKDFRKT